VKSVPATSAFVKLKPRKSFAAEIEADQGGAGEIARRVKACRGDQINEACFPVLRALDQAVQAQREALRSVRFFSTGNGRFPNSTGR